MRIWNGRDGDHGSMHAIGNGKIIVYEQGPDILQIAGPPYGAHGYAAVYLDDYTHCESVREKGTDIWTHNVKKDGKTVVAMTDFCGQGAQFFRVIDAEEPVSFSFDTYMDGVKPHNLDDECFADSAMIRLPHGQVIFSNVVSPNEQYLQIALTGNAKIMIENNKLYIKCGKGHSDIIFAGGLTYPECKRFINQFKKSSTGEILAARRASWKKTTDRLKPVMDSIPDIPERERIINAIDSTAVNIKTQQSDEGGVFAGMFYHLAYVRDEYGVGRCLLALGLHQEARLILEFYLKTFERNGAVHNAQATGVDGFHIYENDNTEIPGYIVMQAMDYYDATGDEQFLTRLVPMLKWAVDAQATQIHKNMLPFSGDETYIAGGIFPRSAVDHGSAEATLIFTHTARFLDWLDARNLDPQWSAYMRMLVKGIKETYKENFISGGRLWTNNPSRFDINILPEFRHGACTLHKCGGYYGWLEKNKHGAYVCPDCLKYDDHKPNMDRYEV
ncbi:MAG TPA: hypothetical protein PLZ84_07435, partial [Clostridia bacterium]|nr:hypothetical protein [Clostridia bacterium]